jgi:UDP-glucose 4-epimerase
MKEVLVIGGSGFVGSHTSDALSDAGYKVTIFDKSNSTWIRDDQKMIIGDMMDDKSLKTAMKNKHFVFHFGGIADIDEADNNPFDTINLNVMGVIKALLACKEAEVKRFLYGSTMYVFSPYGSMYRASKQASETIIETFSDQHSLDYTFLRYGSLYGPRAQKWNGLQSRVETIVNKKKLTYFGTGKEEREYIHIKDAAGMTVKALADQYVNQAITITGSQIINSKDLLEMIFEIANIKPNIEFKHNDLKNNKHYIKTPYRYTPKQSKKIAPSEYIDFGQGLLEVIEEAYKKKKFKY